MIKRTIVSATVAMLCGVAFAQDAKPHDLAVRKTLHLGGPGRWDYVTVDPADHLVYVTRTTHVQTVDPATGKIVADIAGGEGLHGTAIVASTNRGFTTDGLLVVTADDAK